MRTEPRNTRNKRIIIISIFVCFVCFVIIYSFLLKPIPGITTFEQLRASHIKSDALLLDRQGEIIHELRTNSQGRRLDWTPLKDISPALQSAIVAGEDRRFYSHRGVDWISIGAAAFSSLDSSRMRGASTITMQLAAILQEDLQPGKIHRSIFQKMRQIRAARTYEKSWSKVQILEAYLNLVTYRGELQGIAAASRGLFAKEPQGLKNTEGIVLAALVRSPNAGIEAVNNRTRLLAQTMKLDFAPAELKAVIQNSLERPYYVRPQIALAPHVALRLIGDAKIKGERAQTRASCTLDGKLQKFTADALLHHVLSARTQNMHDGSALVVDNKSGEVLAYIGNIGDQSSAKYVDGIQAVRQAGSTLKPFVYALAFEKRLITPASRIEDSPLDVPVQGGVYRPKNYDNLFHGSVTARVALASSLNVPAVKTLNLIGVDSFVDRLRLLGFNNLESPEFYGPSLALGSADVSLWNLVNAYRTLANGGSWSPMRLTSESRAEKQRQAISAEAAFLIADILSDRESRSRTFALESPLSTRFWTAVKTGTSKDMRDNWCVGFSDRFTVGIWAGNFSGQPMWDVTGVTGAAPVWVEIMNWLHSGQSSHKPFPPAGVEQKTVQLSTNDPGKEWFIKGTEITFMEHATNQSIPRIVYPTVGTIVALDPDIPPDDQRIFFETSPAKTDLEWSLDGQIIGKAASLTPWAPRKGKHVLKLMENGQTELDSVDFEVRGN
jgi:penicillin-binding protein 1C